MLETKWYTELVETWYDLTGFIRDTDRGRFSATKFIALWLAYVDGRIILEAKTVSLNALWLALACLSAAFGKKIFQFMLTRMRYSGIAKQEDTKIDVNIRKEILERRVIDKDSDNAFEPT